MQLEQFSTVKSELIRCPASSYEHLQDSPALFLPQGDHALPTGGANPDLGASQMSNAVHNYHITCRKYM